VVQGTCRECGRSGPLSARGLCKRCYGRLQYQGQLDRHPATRMTPGDWFALIDTSDPDACWIWPGPRKTKTGYGNASGGNAHIYVWHRAVGSIPDGMTINHTCHDRDLTCPGGIPCPHRMCVNYERHLTLSLLGDNLLASTKTLARINSEKTHCIHGHPLSGANLGIARSETHVKRFCRICQRAAIRRYAQRKRGLV